ncbi:MAG: Hsp70 family protein, partial [Betaproteobacteria bacterium]|nr:Hsp70 family protein [Betaproteobacteria bacterium]
DANGILHVSAKDKATSKESKITIKANSGLSEEEIRRMVKDAEEHAEEDKKNLEAVNAKNTLEALVHSVTKSLKEHGDKLSADEKSKIEAALKDAEEALKSDNIPTMTAKTEALSEASHKLAEKIYGAEQAAAGQGAPGAAEPGASASGDGHKEENVVDAEFEEVKDKNHK